MRKIILALSFTLAHASFCSADNLAASYIGFCSKSWPCAESLKVFADLPVKRVGWLTATFGERCPCAKEFFKLPGAKYVRVHLANCTCFPERGRSCASNEPFRGESIASADAKLRRKDPTVLRRYRRNLAIAARNLQGAGDTTVRLSLCLESDFSNQARSVLLNEARKVFPRATFVDSITKGSCLPGIICERHGLAPSVGGQCITDTDGDDYRFGVRGNQCEASFLWMQHFNLIRDGMFRLPLLRTQHPYREDFIELSQALRSSP
jgi:hypothetical protein